MEFDEVREYQPGDDVRTIDWNVTARMRRPFVKQFIEERELTVMLLVDVSRARSSSAAPPASRSELAAELAAVLAFSAIRNNDKVGLVLFTDQVEQFIPPRKGTEPRAARDPRGALLRPRGRGHRPRAGARVPQPGRRTGGPSSFLISDFLDAGFERPLR